MKPSSMLLALILQVSLTFCSMAQQDTPLRAAVECTPRGGLPNILAKLDAGAAVRIAYLGGSITEQNGWRPKTLDWFKARYPKARVTEINAAIGGTGSDLGVYRCKHDVLDHRPDLLFVEFAVNDGGAAPDRIIKAMEGIVRQTWRANPATDICFVYTLTEGMVGDLEAGRFPRAAATMERVADHYEIPSIHMGVEVARLHKVGNLVFTGPLPKTDSERAALGDKIVFSPDGVHPYPETGHQLYLDSIARSMGAIAKAGRRGGHRIPGPLAADNWEAAKMVPLSAAKLSAGWEKLDSSTNPIAQRFQRRMDEMWKTNKPGESLTIRFRGTALAIYDLLGPDCGQVSVTLDDRPAVTVPRFDAFSSYHRLATLPVAEGLSNTLHTITIRVLPDQPDKLRILHQRKENESIKELDPKVYIDTAWYAGAILVIGEVER